MDTTKIGITSDRWIKASDTYTVILTSKTNITDVIIEHIVVDDTYKKTYVRLRVAGSETSGMVSFTNAAEAEAFRDEILEKIDRL